VCKDQGGEIREWKIVTTPIWRGLVIQIGRRGGQEPLKRTVVGQEKSGGEPVGGGNKKYKGALTFFLVKG